MLPETRYSVFGKNLITDLTYTVIQAVHIWTLMKSVQE